MATRTYTRGSLATMNPDQLAADLDTALARVGHRVDVNGLTVSVTHAALVVGDDAAVTAAIAAYVFNPDFGQAPERVNLRGKVAVVRQWAQDARDEVTAWDGQTTAQRFAALKITLDRLGKLMDSLADVLAVQGLSGPS